MRYSLAALPVHAIVPGFHGRFVHTDTMTFAYWAIDAAAAIPSHSHPHEQVVNILSSELELTVAGSDCRVLDVFNPVREDYRTLPARPD